MKTIAFFSQKGGSGKSTLAIHAAVAASVQTQTILIDCDPQETSATWAQGRHQARPAVARATPANIHDVLAAAKAQGYAMALMDCPPHAISGVVDLIACADYVVIPVQPTMPDLAAASRAMAMVQAQNKPYAFVINRAPYRAPEIAQTRAALAPGGEVCPTVISDRRAYSRALTDSVAVTEFENEDGKAAQEVMQLWSWIEEKIR